MWTFNKDYKDWNQVDQFYDEFTRLYEEMKENNIYPYNDNFKGQIAGLKDSDDEGTAIYLLQSIKHLDEHKAKVEAKLEGMRLLTDEEKDDIVFGKKVRFARVVAFTTLERGDSNHRIVDEEKPRLTRSQWGSMALMKKGQRTRGYDLGTNGLTNIWVKD
tara:strand:- start:2089 stop:2568 length:480 start_codon:yes stop_codon:yes gene_type:complete